MTKIVAHKSVFAAIIAVCFYVLCFPKYDYFYFAPLFFAFAVLALFSFNTWKQAAFSALFSGFAIGIGGFHWIVYVTMQFGGLPYWLGVVLLLGFCLIAAPHFYLFYVGGFFLRQYWRPLPSWASALLASVAFVATEFLVRHVKLFPENLGNTWIVWIQVAQVASIGGVSLLTFLAILPGAAVATLIFYTSKQRRWPNIALLGSALLLLGFAHFWGAREIAALDALPKEPVTVAMIQANISDQDKAQSQFGNQGIVIDIIRRYVAQTERAVVAAKAQGLALDLIVWPETAYPIAFPATALANDPSRANQYSYAGPVVAKIRDLGIASLLGTYETDRLPESSIDYNSAVLLSGEGRVLTAYRKVMLLLYGERMPFQGIFPAIKKLNPQMGDFGMGPGAIPLDWPREPGKRPLKIGVNICYEAIMPEFMRELAVRGAHFFVNLTNDSWFGPGFEPWQHLQLSQLRTIEVRTPMARTTNTGISAAFDIAGRMIVRGPLFAPENVFATLQIPQEKLRPPYYVFGEWFAWLMVLILLVFLAFCAANRGRKSR